MFQSTRPCGARRNVLYGSSPGHHVSIHAPLRGATFLSRSYLPTVGSFNPRAPAGRDVSSLSILQICGVSIHAPLRGATIDIRGLTAPTRVSIHAPLRGATWIMTLIVSKSQSFNPRAPAGRDWSRLS